VVGGCAEMGSDERCKGDERRGGGERGSAEAVPLACAACPKTLHCGSTRASLRHSPTLPVSMRMSRAIQSETSDFAEKYGETLSLNLPFTGI